MGSAKRTAKKKVNTSQPAYILKQKQAAKLRALLAEKKRQDQARREFELFLAAQSFPNNNNNNWYFPEEERKKKRKTRKLRR